MPKASRSGCCEVSHYIDNFRDPNSNYISEMVDCSTSTADISLIGIPYDGGILSHRRGARLAPNFVRKVLYNFTNYCSNHEIELSGLKIGDYGDLVLEYSNSNIYDQIQSALIKYIKPTKMTIILGGDHSITYPSFKGITKLMEEGNEIINLVVIDQHYDVREYDLVNSGSWLRYLLLDREVIYNCRVSRIPIPRKIYKNPKG